MKIEKINQGSPEWHQFRLTHFGSSEAAAMLGLSTKVKRTELLHMKYTCLPKEFSDWVQENILDHGHEVEALARPILERRIGEDLYPVTCSEGILSASCDGLTMAENIGMEHKQFNQALFDAVSRNELPDEFMVQPQQCMLVTGAGKWLFCVSDGTEKNMATMWVYPSQEWFDRIKAGWAQFKADLDVYKPRTFQEKPEAKAVIELPALFLQAEGRLVNSNMEAFGAALAAHLAETRLMVYVTDQDFADASKRAKMYRDTCDKLTLTKQAMLSQTVSIDEAFRMIDTWHEDLRTTALQIEKDVTKNTEAKKIAIINENKIAFTAHIAELEAGISPIRLTYTTPNFAEAIKGKRLFSAMHDAAQTMLANAKIEYSQVVAGIAANLNWLKQHDEHRALLADLQTIVYKAPEDFQLLVTSRIDAHKRAEEAKIEAAKAAAAAQAVAEERARAEAARLIEEQKAKAEALAKDQADAAEKLFVPEPVVVQSIPTPILRTPVRSTPTAVPTLRLGQIGERLGFALTADFLRQLGFEHSAKDKAALLYHEHQFPEICAALIRRIQAAAQLKAA